MPLSAQWILSNAPRTLRAWERLDSEDQVWQSSVSPLRSLPLLAHAYGVGEPFVSPILRFPLSLVMTVYSLRLFFYG